MKLIQERKSLGTLYHFTHVDYLVEILFTNSLKGYSTSNLGFKTISLTRNYNLKNVNDSTWGFFRLSLNGDYLSDKYKVVPFFDLENLDFDFKKDMPYYTENEEMVITDKVYPLSKYLYQIDFLEEGNKNITELRQISNYLDRPLIQVYEDKFCYFVVNKNLLIPIQLVEKFLPYKNQKI